MLMQTLSQTDRYIKSPEIFDKIKTSYSKYLSNPNSLYSDYLKIELTKNPKLKELLKDFPVYTKYNYGRISTGQKHKPHSLLLRSNSQRSSLEQETMFYIFIYPNGYHGEKSRVEFLSVTKG